MAWGFSSWVIGPLVVRRRAGHPQRTAKRSLVRFPYYPPHQLISNQITASVCTYIAISVREAKLQSVTDRPCRSPLISIMGVNRIKWSKLTKVSMQSLSLL